MKNEFKLALILSSLYMIVISIMSVIFVINAGILFFPLMACGLGVIFMNITFEPIRVKHNLANIDYKKLLSLSEDSDEYNEFCFNFLQFLYFYDKVYALDYFFEITDAQLTDEETVVLAKRLQTLLN